MTKFAATGHNAGVGDGGVFFGLLALLVWAPLPLGSNRVWAMGLLVLAAVLLLLGTLVAWRSQMSNAQARLYLFRWPLGLLAGMVLLAWLQTVWLPAAWVQVLSPNAAAAQMPSEWMTLSVDVYQSRTMAALCFVYGAVFLVTVMVVRDGPRLERLALVLVWSGVLQALLGVVLYSIKAQYTIFFNDVSHGDVIGSFVNRNHMAGYLCMCLSVGIGLMLARLGHQTASHKDWRSRALAVVRAISSSRSRSRSVT